MIDRLETSEREPVARSDPNRKVVNKERSFMRCPLLAGCFLLIWGASFVSAGDTESPTVADAYRRLVPLQLLPLLHAPEVHQEIKLRSEQVEQLEAWFAEVDGPWFRARILTPDNRLKEQAQLEANTRMWLEQNFTSSQRQRLQQLEWQSLGTRMMLRNDFARELGVTPAQQRQLAELAAKNEEVSQSSSKDSPSKRKEAAAVASQKELAAVKTILTDDQQRRFRDVVGSNFDTQKLQRIYPMAPELVPTKTWFNSDPITLASQRGKVVLVHFYAFQCHNCQANFPIYRRWHEKLAERGVVVLGIQTPETPTERDPNAVCKAASETKLAFPILIDVDSENWKAWGNTMWPTVYVIDKRGYIRHWWQGELNWQGATGDKTIEQIVDAALAEPDPA
jgi:peroxiredoxin